MSDAPHPAIARRQDLIAGTVLFLLGLAWTLVVWRTVPDGYGVGPRAFPLWLGIGLTGLSAILLGRALRPVGAAGTTQAAGADEGAGAGAGVPGPGLRLRMVATVSVLIILYGLMMQTLGFLIATGTIVAGTLVVVLGERRWRIVASMSVGMAVGCWLAFGQLLGAYMPRGTWLTGLF